MALARMEAGNRAAIKSVGQGVFVYRLDWGPGYRIYFGYDGAQLVILLAGGTKQRQQNDIAAAVVRWNAYETRNEGRMPLTRDFKETVKLRAERDPAFRTALLTEAVGLFLEGDVATGKLVLRNYINATIGFERLGKDLGKSPKSLMRMLGPGGNPTASSLFSVIGHLQASSGIRLAVAGVA